MALLFFSEAARADAAAEAAARRVAFEVAGAFSNDGFKIRDGHWLGAIKPNEKHIIQVNLYAGNQYWFIAGASEAAKKISVAVFDEAGAPMKTEPYADTARAAAGFSPAVSGPYFIRIEETEGGAASFCLIYSYK